MCQKWLKEEKEKQDGNNNNKHKQQNTANCTKGNAKPNQMGQAQNQTESNKNQSVSTKQQMMKCSMFLANFKKQCMTQSLTSQMSKGETPNPTKSTTVSYTHLTLPTNREV